MTSVYDVIVVGAGVEGSATAYQLINNGAKRVLLLEQFATLHSRGSSGGSSRITRRMYKEPFYVHMMREAYNTWDRLEREAGEELYIQTGILLFGPQNSKEIKDSKHSLSVNRVPYKVFSAKTANQKYPHQLKLPANYECVFEEDGGILLASRCLATLQKFFVKGGGTIKDYHKVTEIIPGDMVTVKTNKGNFEARKVIITAGPWGPAMVKKLGVDLPFKITRTEVLYWKVDNPKHFSVGSFPVFKSSGESGEREDMFYGLPALEYPGLLKVCLHTGSKVDPDHRDVNPAPSTTESVGRFLKTHFKYVSTTPSIYEACIYTYFKSSKKLDLCLTEESPDWNPVLDRHPHHPNIIMGLGFSGHGFKLSPVVGKILAELALDLPPTYDLSPFKVNRFLNTRAKL